MNSPGNPGYIINGGDVVAGNINDGGGLEGSPLLSPVKNYCLSQN